MKLTESQLRRIIREEIGLKHHVEYYDKEVAKNASKNSTGCKILRPSR